MERPKRRSLLVAKIGVATITYVVLASPIACNLPNPEPVPGPGDADPSTDAAPSKADPKPGN
jgi:hypothetical protein